MKQIDMKTKIFYSILLLIIIAGIIVVALKGFNVEKQYQSNDIITIYVGEEIDIEKVKEIASGIFGNNISAVQFVENYKDIVQITAKQITEEQKQEVVDKINEIYLNDANKTKESTVESIKLEENTDSIIDAKDVKITSISNVRIRDLLKPYIISLIIITIIVLIYVGVRFHKIGIFKSILQTASTIILTQLVLVSLMAITRFPIGRFTSTIILVGYMLSIIGIIKVLEKKMR